jgi:3-phenylpropionate/cinnamic acid dioxygenase small subunit
MSEVTIDAGQFNPEATALNLVGAELQHEIEQFLYFEAALLDERRIEEWVALMADDVKYVMPIRGNRSDRDMAKEFSGADGLAYYDESKESLQFRMRKLKSGMAWAESPPSRTRRLVSNIRVVPSADGIQFKVRSSFMLYRTRLERQVDTFVGERQDLLRRVDSPAHFEIVERRILLEQATMLAANLSVFI